MIISDEEKFMMRFNGKHLEINTRLAAMLPYVSWMRWGFIFSKVRLAHLNTRSTYDSFLINLIGLVFINFYFFFINL